MKRVTIVLVLLALTQAVPGALRNYWYPDGSRNGLYWDPSYSATTQYFADGKLEVHFVTQGNYAIPSNSYLQAMLHAFQTWEDVTNMSLGFVRGTNIVTDALPGSEAKFSVGFTDGSGNTQWGGNIGGSVGLSSYSYYLSGRMADTDLCLNDYSAAWSVDGSIGNDVENVTLHEIGHCIGLAHSPDSLAEMSYVGGWFGSGDGWGNGSGNIAGRRVSLDDQMGGTAIYPTASATSQVGRLTGTITVNGTNVHLGHMALYTTNDILVTTTVSQFGKYRFEGLPAGAYGLRAYPCLTNGVPDNLHQKFGTFPTDYESGTSPTHFLSTFSGDVSNLVITAGGTLTQHVAVAAGYPSMRVRYSTCGSLGRSHVFRLRQGSTKRISVAGTNLPVHAGALAELSIRGGGVTTSNLVFGTFAGHREIEFDVNLATNARLGGRPLVIRNTNYPGERYLVFGFVDVFDEPTVTLCLGSNPPVARFVNKQAQGVVMAQFALIVSQQDRARLRSVSIGHVGTGDPAAVDRVIVCRDMNGNGAADGGDLFLATNQFSGSTAVIPLIHTLDAAASSQFLAIYDFSGSASGGKAFSAVVATNQVELAGLNGARRIFVTGGTVTGATVTVNMPATGALFQFQ